MNSWEREIDPSLRGWTIALGLIGAALLAWVILLGTRARTAPQRCPPGYQQVEARCCAAGQGFSEGHCVGAPRTCPSPARAVTEPAPGCVVPSQRILIPGGSVTLGPIDWDSSHLRVKKTLAVRPFYIDSHEVTAFRYHECEKAGLCKRRTPWEEPGLPVTGRSVEEAEAYCAFAGGRLPTAAEWTFAAAGPEARRFPWGSHGLVCRRAAFGLASGPCAEGGSVPELVGMRPDGATPLGVHDLAGNVAELTHDPGGSAEAHGGSFRSERAGELKTWGVAPGVASSEVGFRCVYPVQK